MSIHVSRAMKNIVVPRLLVLGWLTVVSINNCMNQIPTTQKPLVQLVVQGFPVPKLVRAVSGKGNNNNQKYSTPNERFSSIFTRMISSGFTSFDENDELYLVSLQKPMGMVLYQDDATDEGANCIVVGEVIPGQAADRAGIREGDVLVAVQNIAVMDDFRQLLSLEEVLQRIEEGPRILNLRLLRL